MALDLSALIASYPPTFGLRNFPGKIFAISTVHSYTSDDTVMLYLMVHVEVTSQEPDGRWVAFSKGTPRELDQHLVPLTR